MSSLAASDPSDEVRILGLDPSLTSYGVSRLRVAASRKSFTFETRALSPKMRGTSRLEWFMRELAAEVENFQPHAVMLEGYAYAKGNQAHQVGELGGVIRLMFHLNNVGYVEVPPAKLKKFVTGKGNAAKDRVQIEAYKRFGVDTPTSDETEATCLALFAAVGYFGLDVTLPKANTEVFDGLVWV